MSRVTEWCQSAADTKDSHIPKGAPGRGRGGEGGVCTHILDFRLSCELSPVWRARAKQTGTPSGDCLVIINQCVHTLFGLPGSERLPWLWLAICRLSRNVSCGDPEYKPQIGKSACEGLKKQTNLRLKNVPKLLLVVMRGRHGTQST